MSNQPFVLPEMMVHIPLCTHKNPRRIWAITTREEIAQELGRYGRNVSIRMIDPALALEAVREGESGSVDVMLIDMHSSDELLWAHVQRLLGTEGLAVVHHPSLEEYAPNEVLLRRLGEYFKIIMPYHVGDGSTLLLASKEYHPTADVILQRSDLLEGQSYYNCDIHVAAFAMPNYIRRRYMGLVRN